MTARPRLEYPEGFPIPDRQQLDAHLRRVLWIHTFFDHDRARHAVEHATFDRILDTRPVKAGTTPSTLDRKPRALRRRLHLDGATARYLGVPPLAIELAQLMDLVGTRGLMVWHDGAVAHEEYRHGHDSTTAWMSNSATKVITSMLLEQALERQQVGSLDDPLSTYWPQTAGTGWDGVTLDQCLTMTSGIEFTEESLDLMGPSDYSRLSFQLAFGSVDEFLLDLPRRHAPGTVISYASADTEALGGTLMRAVGTGLADQLRQNVWEPAGMESDAYWVSDPQGRELALGGWCATLPDYLRIGLVLLHGGTFNGAHIVDSGFTDRLGTPPQELANVPGHDDYPLIPWNQAFIPSDPASWAGDYMAAGSYGQIIYVNPATRTVIAHHGVCADITTEYIDLHRLFMAFRQIATDLAG